MIHQFTLGGYRIVLDVCSGSLHVVDEPTYDVISLYESLPREALLAELAARYRGRADVTPASLAESCDQVAALQAEGKLFPPTYSRRWPAR